MSFFLQTLYYLFLHIAEHAKSMAPFCSYSSMICLSLFLCWHVRLLPSAVTQCMENTSIDPIHSSWRGTWGRVFIESPQLHRQYVWLSAPFFRKGNWGSKSLSHSPKSHREDLWPGPYSRPSPISPLSNHSLSKSQQLPLYPRQRTWSTYFSSHD